MKGAILIAVALLAIGAAGMIGTHSVSLQVSPFSTSLQDNPSVDFKFYDFRGLQEGSVNVSTATPSGLFGYSNNPLIISTWLMNGESSQFGDSGTIKGYSNNTAVYGAVVWNVLFQNASSSTWMTLYSNKYSENITENGAFGVVFTSGLAFPTMGVYQQLKGIIKLETVVYINTTAAWDQGAYHKTATLYHEFYIVPGSGSISVSPTVQQIGGKVYIHGQVNFGQYYVLLYGSSAYNGGGLIKNFTINGQNTYYNFSYVIPQGAFTNSSNPQANEWTVELWNSLLSQYQAKFFTVDYLSYIPPTPKITITDTPSTDVWIVGDVVDVSVHTTNNVHSGVSVASIVVWVYYDEGGMPASGSSLWIIDNQDYTVTNNYANFSFQLGNLIQSIAISAVAVDSQGRASNTSTIDIQASQITTGTTTQGNIFALAIVAIVVGMGSAVIYLGYPGSGVDKLIIIGGLVGMMAMLYFPINHYFINSSSLIINWITVKGVR